MRIMHEKPETAGAKMSVLCSIHDNRILHLNSIVCVHHVAVNGEAVNSNDIKIRHKNSGKKYLQIQNIRAILLIEQMFRNMSSQRSI